MGEIDAQEQKGVPYPDILFLNFRNEWQGEAPINYPPWKPPCFPLDAD